MAFTANTSDAKGTLKLTTFANLEPINDFIMYSKNWLVIKDDSKKTFEVVGQASNDNSFTNKTYGMQRVGMNVSCITPPVTNKTSSKDLIKIIGYTKEEGLFDRLSREYMEITMRGVE